MRRRGRARPFISFHFISFHFISFHFISFHFISFHFISFHFISFHFISFHFISFHFISFHFISFHFISFHFISFHFISFHFISFHFISFHSFHFISFHFISFHFISFHFISFHFISFHFISFHFISFIHRASVRHAQHEARHARVPTHVCVVLQPSCFFAQCGARRVGFCPTFASLVRRRRYAAVDFFLHSFFLIFWDAGQQDGVLVYFCRLRWYITQWFTGMQWYCYSQYGSSMFPIPFLFALALLFPSPPLLVFFLWRSSTCRSCRFHTQSSLCSTMKIGDPGVRGRVLWRHSDESHQGSGSSFISSSHCQPRTSSAQQLCLSLYGKVIAGNQMIVKVESCVQKRGDCCRDRGLCRLGGLPNFVSFRVFEKLSGNRARSCGVPG